ncbi:MAG: sterol desaturase family protein [Gammaproteobacteria bacterium]
MRNEPTLRLALFLGVFVAMALWEHAAPRRALSLARAARWPGNLGIGVINTLALRLLFPAAAVGFALLAARHGWGLFQYLRLPMAVEVVLSVIVLDLVLYLQHRALHRVPLLWRLHRVHHTDLDMDVTTGVRFHPLEIVLSMLIKAVAVILLGASPPAVLAFEALLNATSMFNHGNVAISPRIDRPLRLLVVTPDMHRIHHSAETGETDSNFGFNLPWWDRCLGTYREAPRGGHGGMRIGLRQPRDPLLCTHLAGLLRMPLGRVE